MIDIWKWKHHKLSISANIHIYIIYINSPTKYSYMVGPHIIYIELFWIEQFWLWFVYNFELKFSLFVNQTSQNQAKILNGTHTVILFLNISFTGPSYAFSPNPMQKKRMFTYGTLITLCTFFSFYCH